MVPRVRLELTRFYPADFESAASTIPPSGETMNYSRNLNALFGEACPPNAHISPHRSIDRLDFLRCIRPTDGFDQLGHPFPVRSAPVGRHVA